MILKDICRVAWGNTNLTKSSYIDKGQFLAVSAAGCDGRINYYEHEANVSVLSAIGAQCGRMFFPNTRFTAIKNTITLTPKDDTLGKYLYYLFTAIELPKRGAGQPFISKGDIEKFNIPNIPSLPIQQKIVIKLDAIFTEIDKATDAAEINTKNAEMLFQSYLTKVFECNSHGWVEKKLKEITTKIGSGATPKGGNESYKETGISLIRSMNVYDDGFYYPKLAFIDDNQAEKLNNVTVEEHDVLLNITGASVSRCCLVPPEILPARVNQHVSILRAIKSKINPKLLHLLLISPLHKKNLLSVGEGGGTTRQAITKVQLQEYVISFPVSQISQNKLIEKIYELYSFTVKIKKLYEEKIKNLPLLKQSILQQAFSGELIKAVQ